jgi:hypothetical protein
MSFLHNIKKGARWLHQNHKTIEAAMELNCIYGKAVLRDACKIAKAIDEPLKIPTIEEVWKVIKPLFPTKQELIQDAFNNCIKCEEKYRLMSQTIQFLATRGNEVTQLMFHGEDTLTFALRINSKPYSGYVNHEYIYVYPPKYKEDDDFTFYEIESFTLWYMHKHGEMVCDDELFVAS